MENQKRELKEDKLVEMLVPDPSQPGAGVRLRGLFGRSSRPGYWRLYLDSSLTDYVEIAEEDIVHHESLASEAAPLNGSLVWVRRGATIQHVRILEQVVEDPFDIVVTSQGSTGRAGAGVPPASYRDCTGDSCRGTCQSSCEGTCSGSCEGTCGGSCGGTCETCASTCGGSCATCGGTCGGSCGGTCSVACTPGRVSTVGDPIDLLERAERILRELRASLGQRRD